MSVSKSKVKGYKQKDVGGAMPDADDLPYTQADQHDPPSHQGTLRTRSTVRSLQGYVRDIWAPKPLKGYLALRTDTGWFGLTRTWVPYWCVFDSRYLMLYTHKPGSKGGPVASGPSVTLANESLQRHTITASPGGVPPLVIPIPVLIVDLGLSFVEASYQDGELFAVVRRDGYPDYVFCGNHIKYWIVEWQKINTVWQDQEGKTHDVPTDVLDRNGVLMEPKFDAAERFFLRQQGAFLIYMHGPLRFQAWNSRTGGKSFLHFCTFDSYDPVPKLCIYSDFREAYDSTPPKIVDLTGATISEKIDSRKRCQMSIQIPGKDELIVEGPNIQWWLGALQWATRDKSSGKAMFRALIAPRRFVPVEKSITQLKLQRTTSIAVIQGSKIQRKQTTMALGDSLNIPSVRTTIQADDKPKSPRGLAKSRPGEKSPRQDEKSPRQSEKSPRNGAEIKDNTSTNDQTPQTGFKPSPKPRRHQSERPAKRSTIL